MRVTIKRLEEQMKDVLVHNATLERENAILKAVNNIILQERNFVVTETLALEKITDAVAHVLTDLVHREKK